MEIDKQLSLVTYCQGIILDSIKLISNRKSCIMAKKKYIKASNIIDRHGFEFHRSIELLKSGKKLPVIAQKKYEKFSFEFKKLSSYIELYKKKMNKICYFHPFSAKNVAISIFYLLLLIIIFIVVMLLLGPNIISIFFIFPILSMIGFGLQIRYMVIWFKRLNLNSKLRKIK